MNKQQRPLTTGEMVNYTPGMETILTEMRTADRETLLLLGHEEILKTETKFAGESLQTWERQEVMLFVHRGTVEELIDLIQRLGIKGITLEGAND